MKKAILATAIITSVSSFGATNESVDIRLLEKRIERIEKVLKLGPFPTMGKLDEAVSVATNYCYCCDSSFNNVVIGKHVGGIAYFVYRSTVLNDGAKILSRASVEEVELFEKAVSTIKAAGFSEIDNLVKVDRNYRKKTVKSQAEYTERIINLISSRPPLTSD